MISNGRQISKQEIDLEDMAETPIKENKIHIEERVCGGCGGKDFFEDRKTKEAICTGCGLVRDDIEDRIDQGQPWRAFSSEETDKRAHAGTPTDLSRFDKGLSTDVGRYSEYADSSGRKLSPTRRAEIYRLRKWQIRTKVHASQMRNLAQAMTELHRLGSQLGVPYSIRETGALIYRKSLPLKLVRGRTIEGMIAASLYLACRFHRVPRPLEELAKSSRLDKKKISQSVRLIRTELENKYKNLRFMASSAEEYVPKFASDLDLSGETRMLTVHILESAREKGLTVGRDPKGLAAAAIYIAGIIKDERRTQREIADTANVTEVTVRNRYKELVSEGIANLESEDETIQAYIGVITKQRRERLEGILEKFDKLPDFPESHQHIVDYSDKMCDELSLPPEMRNIALWISGKMDIENCESIPVLCSSAAVYAATKLFHDLGISEKKYKRKIAKISGLKNNEINELYDIIMNDFGNYEGMMNKLQFELS